MQVIFSTTPSIALYHSVRAGFVLQGKTLSSFCKKNNINPTYARFALTGTINSPYACKIRKKLIQTVQSAVKKQSKCRA